MSDYELENKVAIVTGGAGGIGTHISLEYARAGAAVVVASRNQERIDAVVDRIAGVGGRALAVATDITVPEQVDALIARTVAEFGRLDVMVNNAGGGARMRQPEETPYEDWVRLIDFNLTGTFVCCIAAGKQMIEQKSGNIINISSTAGTKGNPFMLHYSAAKAGMISLTNNLAFMWARHNINVNCIAPGLIATDAMKRHGAIPSDTGGRQPGAAPGIAARAGRRRQDGPLPGVRRGPRDHRRTNPGACLVPIRPVLAVAMDAVTHSIEAAVERIGTEGFAVIPNLVDEDRLARLSDDSEALLHPIPKQPGLNGTRATGRMFKGSFALRGYSTTSSCIRPSWRWSAACSSTRSKPTPATTAARSGISSCPPR